MISDYVLTSDAHKIHFDHYNDGHAAAVILAHGFYNSKQSVLLKELANGLRDSFDIILFDFRGHGKSSGLFYWTVKEYLDLLAVLEYAQKHYKKIGVVGFSLGAATSIITASKTKAITSLIVVSGPTEMSRIEYHFWKMDFENDVWYGLLREGGRGKGIRPGPFWYKKEKPIELVGQLKQPILYIHGTADWVIDISHSQKLFERTNSRKELTFIPNGLHAEYLVRKYKEKMVTLTREWFNKTLA